MAITISEPRPEPEPTWLDQDSNSCTRSTTMWSGTNNFDDTEIPKQNKQTQKTTQNNRTSKTLIPKHSVIPPTNNKQNIEIIDPHARFLGKPTLEELMNNSKDIYYSDYLEEQNIPNIENLKSVLFTLERSRLFALTFLEFGTFELFKRDDNKSEDEYTKKQLVSIYGLNTTQIIAGFLTKSVFTAKKMPVKDLSKDGPKYLTETFREFWSHESLNNLVKSCKNSADIKDKVYFIAVVIASLWTKAGHRESHAYLTAFRQALCSSDKNKVIIKHESNLYPYVIQGASIAIPGTSGPAVYTGHANSDYYKKHKNKNNLDFIVTVEMATACYEMINDIHASLNEIVSTQSAEKQSILEEQGMLYHWNKFQEAKKEIQVTEKGGAQEEENSNLPSAFNKEAYSAYQKWLDANKI